MSLKLNSLVLHPILGPATIAASGSAVGFVAPSPLRAIYRINAGGFR